MDSEILDQLTNLERDVDSEFPKPKRGRKKKADTKINEFEDNDIRDKRYQIEHKELASLSFLAFNPLLVQFFKTVSEVPQTQKCTKEKNTLNSKLMTWIIIASMHF